MGGEFDGRTFYFDTVAPITGDGIYRYVNSETNVVTHAILPHPKARENQLRHFHRGS